jgi:UDP-N-acetyl-D-galactosamine dehydrogenase
MGYSPKIILSGRKINDGVGDYVAEMTIQKIVEQESYKEGDKVVVLGLTFKENCPDLRNSKVVDVINGLKNFGLDVFVHDPIADPNKAFQEFGIKLTPWEELPSNVAAIVAAVSHKEYSTMPINHVLSILRPNAVFTDVKSTYDIEAIEKAGHSVWRL